jgi:hypothetical protein
LAAKQFLNHSNLQTTELYVRSKLEKKDVKKLMEEVMQAQKISQKHMKSKNKYIKQHFDFDRIKGIEDFKDLVYEAEPNTKPSSKNKNVNAKRDQTNQSEKDPLQEESKNAHKAGKAKKNFKHYNYKKPKK